MLPSCRRCYVATTNPFNIQMLAPELLRQLFPSPSAMVGGGVSQGSEGEKGKLRVELAIQHLKKHGLWGKPVQITPPVKLELPKLQGSDIRKHFESIGRWASEPYFSWAEDLSRESLPPMPTTWKLQPGWTRYPSANASTIKEKAVVFDVETCPNIAGHYPLLACAASPEAWYGWISPAVFGGKPQLIDGLGDERLVVGHNVGFDRARLAEEYQLKDTATRFIDTLSLHMATAGLCTRQRPEWNTIKKALEQDDLLFLSFSADALRYYDVSSTNSLAQLLQFYCGSNAAAESGEGEEPLDKSVRDDIFHHSDWSTVPQNLPNWLTYCARDVLATHKIFQKIWPRFLKKCPHPVSFAGMLRMASPVLPVNRTWPTYVADAEACFQQKSKSLYEKLAKLAQTAIENGFPLAKDDPWLRQLDWTIKAERFTKPKYKKDGSFAKGGEPRPQKRQFLPGMPQWVRENSNRDGTLKLTTRTRIAPLLLKLKWRGYPLYYSALYGWTFRVPLGLALEEECGIPLSFPTSQGDPSFEPWPASEEGQYVYLRIPHPNGDEENCGNPLAKHYITAFEQGILTSEYPLAREALEINAMCSYWISARERVNAQFVQWTDQEQGVILPQVQPMGTVTRRAVEATWLTASNARPDRIGSELKAMVKAPPGYVIVGADVDSEELWISALMGDAAFGEHGASALGWMTLQGDKKAGTDLHSRTAQMLGISRDYAKVFNYGRIYGAGVKFAARLLRRFNPSLSQNAAEEKARLLYQQTKGNRLSLDNQMFWAGGSESFMFNALEMIAAKDPLTPVLGCGISDALHPRFAGKLYLTSRINWVVQSSGVDYLHLLLVAIDYLNTAFSLDLRYLLSVHDEVRFLAPEAKRYEAAWAMQVANLWTRAMFAQTLGFNDLPQCVAFFSTVEIDQVWRKDPMLSCVTPSHPLPIAPGESLDIYQILEKLSPSSPFPSNFPSLQGDYVVGEEEERTEWKQSEFRLKAQLCTSRAQLSKLKREK